MALKLSKNVALTDLVTDLNPITTEHPIGGSSVELKLFLFNDQAAKKYENISVKPTDETDTDESDWIQLAPDNSGSAGVYGSTLAMANITDSNVAKPFWMKVTTPSVGDTQNKSDIKLTITGKEYAV